VPDPGAVYLLPGRPGEALVFADAILGAITDGVDQESPCPKPISGNTYTENADTNNTDNNSNNTNNTNNSDNADNNAAVPIATGLGEALAAFRASDLPARLFGAAVAEHLARAAALEVAAHRDQITDSELHRAMRA
jgi:glutamine synthetase